VLVKRRCGNNVKLELVMRAFVFCVVVLLGGSAFPQECKQVLPTTILNEKTGEFVATMTADRLKVKIGGVLRPVASLEPLTRSRVLILFDASGSMEAGDTMDVHQREAISMVKRTLKESVDELPRRVEVQYGIFNSQVEFGGRFTSDPAEAAQGLADATARLAHPEVSKQTALFDAIYKGLGQFDAPSPGDSILVVTDGGDNVSKTSSKKLEEDAGAKGIRFYIIWIKPRPVQGEEALLPDPLVEFTERTGGSIWSLSTTSPSTLWAYKASLPAQSQDLRRYLLQKVLSGYTLHFAVPSSIRDTKWKLSIDSSAYPGQRLLGVYPTRLRPCESATSALR
jgi:hypothetical protein